MLDEVSRITRLARSLRAIGSKSFGLSAVPEKGRRPFSPRGVVSQCFLMDLLTNLGYFKTPDQTYHHSANEVAIKTT